MIWREMRYEIIYKKDGHLKDLRSYDIQICKYGIEIVVSAADLLYGMLNSEETNFPEYQLTAYRKDLWNLFLQQGDRELHIESAEIFTSKIRGVLQNRYQLPQEIWKLWDYVYFEDEVKMYLRSFHSEKKACEMYFTYRASNSLIPSKWAKSYTAFLGQKYDYINFLPSVQKGGEFYGCYYDEEGRIRPLHKPKYQEVKDSALFVYNIKFTMPRPIFHYIFATQFTSDEVYHCYGGRENFINRFGLSKTETLLDEESLLDKARHQFFSEIPDFERPARYILEKYSKIETVNWQYTTPYESIRKLIIENFSEVLKFVNT